MTDLLSSISMREIIGKEYFLDGSSVLFSPIDYETSYTFRLNYFQKISEKMFKVLHLGNLRVLLKENGIFSLVLKVLKYLSLKGFEFILQKVVL